MSFDRDLFRKAAILNVSELNSPDLPDPAFVSEYLPVDKADAFFNRLREELPWQEKWPNHQHNIPQKVYHYGVSERDKSTSGVLEELIWMVEHLHDARASEVWCNMFNEGRNFGFSSLAYDQHATMFNFGAERRVLMKEGESGVVSHFLVKHGDIFTWSPETGQRFEVAFRTALPASNLRVGEGKDNQQEGTNRISIVIWTARPKTGR